MTLMPKVSACPASPLAKRPACRAKVSSVISPAKRASRGPLQLAGREGQAALPRDYREFKARYQQEGRTPEGAVKLYFEAVFCYIDEATRAEGSKMVRYALHYDRPIEQSYNLATFVERLKDPEMHHIFRGFAEGTSPENDYRMSPDNFNLVVTKKVQEQGYLRVFLRNSGAEDRRAHV